MDTLENRYLNNRNIYEYGWYKMLVLESSFFTWFTRHISLSVCLAIKRQRVDLSLSNIELLYGVTCFATFYWTSNTVCPPQWTFLKLLINLSLPVFMLNKIRLLKTILLLITQGVFEIPGRLNNFYKCKLGMFLLREEVGFHQ